MGVCFACLVYTYVCMHVCMCVGVCVCACVCMCVHKSVWMGKGKYERISVKELKYCNLRFINNNVHFTNPTEE